MHAFNYCFNTSLQCNHSVALRSYFHQLNNPPTKVGWVGSGCSVATEPTAELTHYYNITQVLSIILHVHYV